MKILRYILGVIRALLVLITMALYLGFYWITCIFKGHTPERAFWIRKKWIALCIRILNVDFVFEPSVDNITDEPVLFISNHRSFSDPIFFAKYLDAYIIAKAEVSNLPVVSTGAKVTGIIFVKRESFKSRAATKTKMVEVLKSGYNVLVYAEGTTSDLPTSLPFKKGTFREAANHGFAVVPIAVIYNDPRDHWMNRSMGQQYFRQFGKWKAKVTLAVGPKLKNTDETVLREECQAWVNERILQG